MKQLVNKIENTLRQDYNKRHEGRKLYIDTVKVDQLTEVGKLLVVSYSGYIGDSLLIGGFRTIKLVEGEPTIVKIKHTRAYKNILAHKEVSYTREPKVYSYVSHMIIKNAKQEVSSIIVYHGIEAGRMVFSINKVEDGKVAYRSLYRPKKVYSSSKGNYVNVVGSRLYFNDLYSNYMEIHNIVKEGR